VIALENLLGNAWKFTSKQSARRSLEPTSITVCAHASRGAFAAGSPAARTPAAQLGDTSSARTTRIGSAAVAIKTIEARLEADHFETGRVLESKGVGVARSGLSLPAQRSAANQQVVRSAIERLSSRGATYKPAVDTSKERLARAYY
jgi:hypothetical protein